MEQRVVDVHASQRRSPEFFCAEKRKMGKSVLLLSAACACAALLLSFTYDFQARDVKHDDRPVELSMRMRGHDLKASAAKHTEVVPKKQTTASPHAAKPAGPPKPVLSAAQIAKQKEEDEIWNSEQAMKKQLDDSVKEKGSNLWKQTVDVVHKNDPNAKIIHSLEVAAQHGPQHAPEAKTTRHSSSANSDQSMTAKMKADLNTKVSSDIHSQWKSDQAKEQKGFSKSTKGIKVAETAQAHSKMPLTDMKHILKSQLDNSVKSVVDRAKQLSSFNSNSQLKARLKAELDTKTKQKQKKLLRLAALKHRLQSQRHGLSGKVSRAEAVRAQLTKEMKEENAIRSQLDASAKKQGQAMLHHQTDKKHTAPQKLTKQDLENQLRKRLRAEDQSSEAKPAGRQQQQDEERGKAKAKQSLLNKALGARGQQKGGLAHYLRHQLETADSHRQHKLYQHTLQGNLLKRVEKMVASKHASVDDKNKAIQNAEMKLFKESMQGAEQREAQEHAQSAHDQEDDAIMSKDQALLHKALQLEPKKKAGAGAGAKAAAGEEAKVLSTESKVLAGTMHRASEGSPSQQFKPFAHLHAQEQNIVHDMAHASERLAHSLGHTKALQEAAATSAQIKADRQKMLSEAQHDEDEAVE